MFDNGAEVIHPYRLTTDEGEAMILGMEQEALRNDTFLHYFVQINILSSDCATTTWQTVMASARGLTKAEAVELKRQLLAQAGPIGSDPARRGMLTPDMVRLVRVSAAVEILA